MITRARARKRKAAAEASEKQAVPAAPRRREPVAGLPRIGVAFGGGGARGLAHIHVIRELDALGIRPTAISGSSIGAIMGAAMAAGMTGDEIHEHAMSVLSDRAQAVARIWRARPSSFNDLVSGGFRVSQFNVEKIIKAFLPDHFPHDFSDLEIPLKVTATDFFGHKSHVFSKGELISALGASAAIPALFRPVKREGLTLIDGGIYNPVPFDVFGKSVDLVIAVDVVGSPQEIDGKAPSAIDLMFGASQLMMQSIIAMKLHAHAPDIVLRPPVAKFRVLDFLKIEQVLAATAPVRKELRKKITAALPQLTQGDS